MLECKVMCVFAIPACANQGVPLPAGTNKPNFTFAADLKLVISLARYFFDVQSSNFAFIWGAIVGVYNARLVQLTP